MEGPTLVELKAEASRIATESKDTVWVTRADGESARFCKWDGQAPDGLKHESYLGEEPEPFEGSSDTRIRLADITINEDVMLLVTAAMRAQINFRGTEKNDLARAGNMAIFMRWVLRNYLGVTWIKELIKLANYMLGDTPGIALLGINWRQERALRLERVDIKTLMDRYVKQVVEVAAQNAEQGGGVASEEEIVSQAQQAAIDFQTALADQEYGEADLADLLMQFYPIKPARARKVVKDLRKTGFAEFPMPYIKRDGPDVCAKRIYEDWYIAANTGEFQESPLWFESEWMSKAKILERQITDGWSEKFIEGVVGKKVSEYGSDGVSEKREGGQEGVAAFPTYVYDKDGNLVVRDAIYYTGLYQIVTAYYMAIDEDGIPGKYFQTFHPEVDVAAFEPRLLDYKHGKYPGHVFQREILSSRMMDSRGIAEVAGPVQGLLKMYFDSFGDHAQIAGVPPILSRGRQRMGALRIGPLKELILKRDGDVRFMDPPKYPATCEAMIKQLTQQHNEYFGRPGAEVPEGIVALQREFKILWFLQNVREALSQMFALCQQYAPDELVQRVTNREGEPILRSAEEIQGQYDLELAFDPRDMDIEYLKVVAEIIKNLLMAMDRDQTIQSAPIVSALLWRLSPELAEASVKDVDTANRDQLEDEVRQYQKIRAGTEPILPDDGSVNYAIRLQLYRDLQAANPEVFADMAPDKMAILDSRLKRMEMLVEQFGTNAEIGRQGGKTALPELAPTMQEAVTAAGQGQV